MEYADEYNDFVECPRIQYPQENSHSSTSSLYLILIDFSVKFSKAYLYYALQSFALHQPE